MSTKLTPLSPDETRFAEVVGLVAAARQQALQSVNTTLIDLYWQVEYAVSRTLSPPLIAEYETLLPDKHSSRQSCMSFTC